MVSPDGSAIAYGKQTGRLANKTRQLCVYTFADANKVCYEVPEAYNGSPYQLVWSPDSAYIAFTENPLQLGFESDIWLVDIAEGTFTNLTDDGAEGAWRTLDVDYALDYLPTWDQSSGDLYFWRSVPSGDFAITLELYRISPDGGDAELVRDLTEDLKQQLIRFDYEKYYMDGPSAVSPDGTKLVLTSTSFEDVYDLQNGLWLIDLTDDTAPPQQLADMDDFQSALPVWQQFPAIPMGLSWTSDSAGVVVLATSEDTHTPMNVFYYVDAETGDITPVVDFSGLEEVDAYFEPMDGSEGLPARYYSPWTASLSPLGDKLLMYNDLAGLPGMMAALLPPDGNLPRFIYESETSSSALVTRSSRGSDGKVLMYGFMFTVTEE
jgi:Tol biopolymer transport system component